MRYQTLGDKPNFVDLRVRNDETVSVPAGTPVAYVMDGTEDCLAVIKPSTSNLKATTFLAGILTGDLAATGNKLGNARAYGVVDAIIVFATRAATTDSFASNASHAVGEKIYLNTGADAIALSATAASALDLPLGALAETIASQASSASATTITALSITAKHKIFLRALGG